MKCPSPAFPDKRGAFLIHLPYGDIGRSIRSPLLAADDGAAALIGENDAAVTVKACNHDTARRYINHAGAAKTHAACLFFRKPGRAATARAIRATPAGTMAIAILNLNSELNIRACGSRWRSKGNSTEGDEGSQAGFCEGAEHELTPFVALPTGEHPPAIDETLDSPA
jgi:hypothetical protein